RVLYGLDQARAAIGQRGRILIVEGYFDVLSLHQSGFGEAVATCGTALTPDHIERIRRLTRDVILLMDADEAGLRAAERALPAFVEVGIQPWRVSLPGAKDPDELLREEGGEALEAALAGRQPLFEWVIDRKLDSYGVSTMSRDRILEEVLPLLRRMHDDHLTRDIANRLDMSRERLAQLLADIRRRPAAAAIPAPAPAPEGWQPHRDVSHLLWLLVHRYAHVADIIGRADPRLLDGHARIRPVVARLLSGEPVASIIPEQSDPGISRTLLAVVARDRLYSEDESARAAVDILVRLSAPLRRARLHELPTEIKRLEQGGDVTQLLACVQEQQALIQEQRALEAAVASGTIDDVMAILGRTDAHTP
ncbi:MAG TPA: toprim domain-containing protein, partial [Deltaproteobacteria bacterium]|nr:toprim domain-containing protein [Deltaproteobacteria bacterium]